MVDNQLARLISFAQELQSNNISFSLDSVRDAIMVTIPMPDRYLEAEFFADGHVEVQSFGPPSSQVLDFGADELLEAVVDHMNSEDESTLLSRKLDR